MANAFDDRKIKLTISVDGKDTVYDESFAIYASGTKFTNGNLGDCRIKIDNIAKETRNFLLTKTSPFIIGTGEKRLIPLVKLEVGRKSYGTFVMFEGNAVAGSPTQPPDIGLVMTSLAGSILLGTMSKIQMQATSPLKDICQRVADANAVALDYQASDKMVGSFSYTGPTIQLVDKLNEVGGINAFIDTNKTLVVIDSNRPRKGSSVLVSKETGMIGVPQLTELGVTVRMLIINELRAGDQITISSTINPAANGDYTVFTLGYEVASRDVPFYWIINARRFALGVGNV